MPLSTPSLVHQQHFTVRSYDVDFQRHLRTDVLCGFFQEVASEHALKLGVGYQQLDEQQLFWVLSRLLLQITKLPRWHEEIIIETWAKGTDRLFALRDFVVRNGQGEILIQATSYWLMLNANSRRPVRPDSFFARLKHEAHAIDEPIEKLESTKAKLSYTEIARYTELDHNQHVNNIRYVSWMLNSFPLDFFSQHELQTLQINFQSELREGDSVEIYRHEIQAEKFLISGYRQGEEQASFNGKLQWRRK
ncbi:medium-chain acyl-[acyl-carrier-protein] hydrolase [Catalinimonas alkaloidigena]|uniref:acyl-[acyl-carrier-protein] thioesterase n=1 Tax=Catalinimonas alkaloidigena TaxID=1075417 RepID=UPI002404AF1D|nr:acyl-ACP thioesterase domain-containing protein [Catalinimonas alkaloidigena]MDF9799924.1 medium-chain acyl-[acyl-carrier-protein] hydrolase [Catalinimonas alkaloidigena]